MSVGSRIKDLREERGLSRPELARLLNVTVSAISNYENEISSPKEPVLFKIIETFDCDANYLFQDVVKIKDRVNDVSFAEYEHIKKYRSLDDSGKSHIDYELDRECKRIEEIRKQKQYIESLKSETSTEMIPTRIITYFNRIASAGSGEYLFDGMPTDLIKVADTPVSRKADFVIGVNGQSMEPDYCDGEKVFVEITPDIENGEIGVFVRGNECFIKECGKNGLISRNPEYPDVQPFSDGIRVVGKVIGKAIEI